MMVKKKKKIPYSSQNTRNLSDEIEQKLFPEDPRRSKYENVNRLLIEETRVENR